MAKSKTPPAGGRKPNHKMLSRTLFVLIVCGIVAFFALGIQLFNVMILKHDEYESGAIAQQVRRKEVTAMRGTIYDRNGKILAQSATRETVILSPADIRKNDEDAAEICRELVEVLGDKYGVTYEDLMKKAQKTDSYYEIVTRRIDPEEADALRAYKEEHECTGIWLAPDSKRYYPYGSLASHVIGFVGLDNNGLAGVESEYDNALSGSTGRIVRAADGQGTGILLVRYEDYSAAAAGQDVTLTLDATIQYYMEKQLKQAVEDYDVQNGAAAIAMDPNTGAILGMASLGNFDLNDYQAVDDKTLAAIEETESKEERQKLLSDAQQRMWRNKALSDTYEPGSTFKIITLSMALEEGVVSMDDTFPCGGSTMVRGRNEPLKCWKTTGHGSQTLTQAVQHSCNVAFVNIGQRVGAEKFYEYAENFGFLNLTGDKDATLTARTGIDLRNELNGIVLSGMQEGKPIFFLDTNENFGRVVELWAGARPADPTPAADETPAQSAPIAHVASKALPRTADPSVALLPLLAAGVLLVIGAFLAGRLELAPVRANGWVAHAHDSRRAPRRAQRVFDALGSRRRR